MVLYFAPNWVYVRRHCFRHSSSSVGNYEHECRTLSHTYMVGIPGGVSRVRTTRYMMTFEIVFVCNKLHVGNPLAHVMRSRGPRDEARKT